MTGQKTGGKIRIFVTALFLVATPVSAQVCVPIGGGLVTCPYIPPPRVKIFHGRPYKGLHHISAQAAIRTRMQTLTPGSPAIPENELLTGPAASMRFVPPAQ
jgi:hypothetical protein